MTDQIKLSNEEVEFVSRLLAVSPTSVRNAFVQVGERRRERRAEIISTISAYSKASGGGGGNGGSNIGPFTFIDKSDKPQPSAGPYTEDLRKEALRLAVSSRDQLSTFDDIVSTAQAFLTFLEGSTK